MTMTCFISRATPSSNLVKVLNRHPTVRSPLGWDGAEQSWFSINFPCSICINCMPLHQTGSCELSGAYDLLVNRFVMMEWRGSLGQWNYYFKNTPLRTSAKNHSIRKHWCNKIISNALLSRNHMQITTHCSQYCSGKERVVGSGNKIRLRPFTFPKFDLF